MTNKELIHNFEKLVQEERRITRAVLEHIAEIEFRKAYLDLGYEGMYSYLTKGLGYSEGSAYRRLQAARVYRVEPKVAEKLESGALNLMQLTEVAKLSGLGPAGKFKKSSKPEKASKAISPELLAKLESKSKSETEMILAKEFDVTPKTITKTTAQKDRSVRLEITLSEEQFKELEKAKSLLSHICPDGAWVDVITELARQYTRKYTAPDTKTNKTQSHSEESRVKNSKVNENSVGKTPPVKRHSVRPSIPISVRRLIFRRSQGTCEHIDPDTGRRCESRYQPQFDHIFAFSKGGGHEVHNLQLLCGHHNRAKGSS